jgi:hypothetical protein
MGRPSRSVTMTTLAPKLPALVELADRWVRATSE